MKNQLLPSNCGVLIYFVIDLPWNLSRTSEKPVQV